jgi:oxygen-dependent protoporphyrinogen oxidase
MQALPDALAHALGDRLRLDSPVRALRAAGSGWRLDTDQGIVDARAVVLTCPAGVTARLLTDVAPSAGNAVAALRYNPLGVVHLDAETDLRGLGFQVAFTEPDLALRGVTWNDSLFGRRGLHTAYLGGSRHPEVIDLTDADLADLAVREFRHCTGFESRPLAVARERMPAWDVSWRAIQGIALPDGLHFAANWWSRPGIPGRLAEAERLARTLAAGVGVRAHARA